MQKAMFSQGPNVTLLDRDVKTLNERGYCDFDFGDINGTLRIIIHDGEIPPRNMCERGIDVRRFPEDISPYDYKGKQLWIVKLSKERLSELVSLGPSVSDGHGFGTLMSRCKYDRMSVSYLKTED